MKKYVAVFLIILSLMGSAAFASSESDTSGIDWSVWIPPSETNLPIKYQHADTEALSYESYVSWSGFTGFIPWDGWRENEVDYTQFCGWSQQQLIDYLAYLRLFGYQIVSNVRLNHLRMIVAELKGTADLPPYITITYDRTGCADGTYRPTTLIAVDASYNQTHDLSNGTVLPGLRETQGMEIVETKAIDSFSFTLPENEKWPVYIPQSKYDDFFTIQRETMYNGNDAIHCQATKNHAFIAIRLRVEDTALIPSPQQVIAYSMIAKHSIVNFAVYTGVEMETVTEESDKLQLSQLPPAGNEPFYFWILLPMYVNYLEEPQWLFLSTTPGEYLDPEKQLFLNLPGHPEWLSADP